MDQTHNQNHNQIDRVCSKNIPLYAFYNNTDIPENLCK